MLLLWMRGRELVVVLLMMHHDDIFVRRRGQRRLMNVMPWQIVTIEILPVYGGPYFIFVP